MRLFNEALRPRLGRVALAIGALFIAACGAAALAWLLDPAVRLIFLEKRADMLVTIPLAVVGVAITAAVAAYVASAILAGLGQRAVADLQARMFASLAGADLAALDRDHSGAQSARFIFDTVLARDLVTRGFTGLVKDSLTLILLLGIMFYLDWSLALAVLIVAPVGGAAMRWIHHATDRAAHKSMQATEQLATGVAELLGGRRVVKAYGLEQVTGENARAVIERRRKALLQGDLAASATQPISDVLGGVGMAAVVAYAGWRGITGDLPLNEFMSFVGATLMAFQPIRALASLTTVFAQGTAALGRIYALVDVKPSVASAPGAPALSLQRACDALIRFDDVHFEYAEGRGALHGLSFAVAPGETVALVGPSGAGKSSVLNLLLRFYDPQAGRISVAGQNIAEVSLPSLRSSISLVTQEPFLFDDTIYANIACARPGATRAQVEAAAVSAAAHDFILAQPQGYDTRVGEAGARLSGGQRQRIAIARALLKNAPILLLDEATSALDAGSERLVQEALEHLMQGRTTLIVAHRLSTVVNAGRILVLSEGRLSESGSHAALAASGGIYADLFNTQFAAGRSAAQ